MAYELIKVSELPELTTPSDPNVLPIQDGDYLKRISFENLKDAATGDVAGDLATEVTARGNADTAILADLASAYSTSATYAVGDYCIKDGQLYRCTTAIATAEAWTSGHWSAVELGEDVSTLRSALSAEISELNDRANNEMYLLKSNVFSSGTIRYNDGGTDASLSRIYSTRWTQGIIMGFIAAAGYEFAVVKRGKDGTTYLGFLQTDGTYAKSAAIAWLQFYILPYDGYTYQVVGRNKANPASTITVEEGANIKALESNTKWLLLRNTSMDGMTENVQFALISNKYIKDTNGAETSYTGWKATDYIKISDYTYLTVNISTSSQYGWFYDNNKQPLAQATVLTNPENVLSIPQDAVYFRTSQSNAVMDALSIYGYRKIDTIIEDIEKLKGQIPQTKYLKYCTWNVGLFNNGISKVSTADAPAQIIKYNKAIGAMNGGVFTVQEYVAYIDESNTIPTDDFMAFKYNYSSSIATRRIFSVYNINNLTNVSFASGSGRGYTYGDIMVGGKVITIINTHLSIEVDPTIYRNTDVQELISFMDTKEYVILSGDFNVYTDSEYSAFTNAGYVLCNGGSFGWFKTWPVNIEGSLWGTEHLDNIIVSSNIVPQNVETYETSISDHAPLIAYLQIN